MKSIPAHSWVFPLLFAAAIGLPLDGIAAAQTSTAQTTNERAVNANAVTAQYGPLYANLQGEVVLDNPRVFVQKFTVLPGQSTGPRTHPGDQLQVFIKGGVLTSAAGRSTLWRDGRVVWHGAGESGDAGGTNTGPAPIEMIWVKAPSRVALLIGRYAGWGRRKRRRERCRRQGKILAWPQVPLPQLSEHSRGRLARERSGHRSAFHGESRSVGGSTRPSSGHALYPY